MGSHGLGLTMWPLNLEPGPWLPTWSVSNSLGLIAQMVKKICLQCGRPGFHPWVGKMPWRRAWQPTLVFLPGESHGQRSLVGYGPWGHRELDTAEQLSTNSLGLKGPDLEWLYSAYKSPCPPGSNWAGPTKGSPQPHPLTRERHTSQPAVRRGREQGATSGPLPQLPPHSGLRPDEEGNKRGT